ncbi:hypothetical protein HMPREF9373_1430 [Psychrobacter sp. 1501(2011)]|nr:hypothetical protein HMPREF9373_1430 [Psychrobacter sp. 1501(2011)]
MNMGLLDKYRAERDKYISIIDFINLIAYQADEFVDDVFSYLIINDFETKVKSYTIDIHTRIFEDEHLDVYGFDYNTRVFLETYTTKFFFSKYIRHSEIEIGNSRFYYSKEQLQLIDIIASLNLDFDKLKQVNKEVSDYSEELRNPIYRNFKGDFDNPNMYQLELFKKDYLTAMEAASMLAGVSANTVREYRNHPRFTEVYSDYIGYKLMIDNAIKDKVIKAEYNALIDYDHEVIKKSDLEVYLYESGYILKGFNDWLNIEPAKKLIRADVDTNQQMLDIQRSSAINNDNRAIDYLSAILDESNPAHAPDLKHAINLWIDLYVKGGIKGDSHSNKANLWIGKNTRYSPDAKSSIDRIREVTTPLKDFGTKRSRENE